MAGRRKNARNRTSTFASPPQFLRKIAKHPSHCLEIVCRFAAFITIAKPLLRSAQGISINGAAIRPPQNGERHEMRTFFVALSLLILGLSNGQAAAVHFGADLNKHTQPSNAGTGDYCNINTSHQECTFVLMQAYQCEFGSCLNGHLAPQDGTISSVSLIACAAGSFVLQIAQANATKKTAKVITSGPVIDYLGDPQKCDGDTYQIENFPVNVPVKKGDYLAVDAQKVGFVRCSGGGDNMLLFHLPLADGVTARKSNGEDGCFMLLEAFYAPAPTRPSFGPWRP
jgi:hypothetical protein